MYCLVIQHPFTFCSPSILFFNTFCYTSKCQSANFFTQLDSQRRFSKSGFVILITTIYFLSQNANWSCLSPRERRNFIPKLFTVLETKNNQFFHIYFMMFFCFIIDLVLIGKNILLKLVNSTKKLTIYLVSNCSI